MGLRAHLTVLRDIREVMSIPEGGGWILVLPTVQRLPSVCGNVTVGSSLQRWPGAISTDAAHRHFPASTVRWDGGMDLSAFVTTHGGVIPSSWLRARRVSSRRLTDAIRSGALIRPRRGWVAVPTADPELIRAAGEGVVITCISLARRRGLWVLKEPEWHVAAPSHAGHVGLPGAVMHWRAPLVPRPPGSLEDEIENMLVQVALCQPDEAAQAIWESALRTGRADIDRLRNLPLPERASRLCDQVTPWSDSGLETIAVVRLRWLGLPLRPQIWIAGHRVDLLIGDRLVLQIDGGTHVGAQRDSDNRHDAELRLRGYHVIRVGYRQVVESWPEVQALIMAAVAAGLHRRPR